MSQARMGDSLALALALEGKTVARGETAELVALAGALAALPEPQIDAAFADVLEQQLLSVEQVVQTPRLTVVPAPQPQPQPEPRRQNVVTLPRRRVVVKRWVASVAAAAMLGAFPVAAAASSLPGSPAYGIKLKIEQLKLALFGTPLEDGFTHMEYANIRVSEAEQLVAIGADADLIAATLRGAEDHIRAAGRLVFGATNDLQTLERFADQAQKTGDDLGDVGDSAPASARPAADSAIDAVQAILNVVAAAGDPSPDIGLTDVLANAETAAVDAPRAEAPQQSSSTEAQGSGGGSGGDDIDATGGSVDRPQTGGKGGNGKLSEDAGDVGCSAPGSENGTGDLFAPVVRVFCG